MFRKLTKGGVFLLPDRTLKSLCRKGYPPVVLLFSSGKSFFRLYVLYVPLHDGAEKLEGGRELGEGVVRLHCRRSDGDVLAGASNTVGERHHAHVDVVVATNLRSAIVVQTW